MHETTRDIQRTFFVPKSALDAVNYLMLGSEIKIAAQEVVPAVHLHFLDDFRDLIRLYRQTYRIVITNDGSAKRSVGRELIQRMDEFLEQLESAGLRLCFRMWSLQFEDMDSDLEVNQTSPVAPLGLDQDDSETGESAVADESINSHRRYGCGAIVGFMVVPHSIPVEFHESNNGHDQIFVEQVPDWDELPDWLWEA